jgi:hypothetical protein
MDTFPVYWLCKCGHRKDKHGFFSDTLQMACLFRGENNLDPINIYADFCNKFNPVDNLTMIETLAKGRK